MPRKRYEEEIEEILEKMDPLGDESVNAEPDQTDSEMPRDKAGRLIHWEEVQEARPEPRRSPRKRGGGSSSTTITPTRLIVGAVGVLVFAIATRILFVPLLIVSLLLFGGAYYLSNRGGGSGGGGGGLLGGGRQKYWRDTPIDYDSEDPEDPPNQWRGG